MKNPQYLDVNGIETRYFEAEQGRPLVLVHGGDFGDYYGAYHWSRNFDALSATFHVYALDNPGSTEPGRLTAR